MDNLTERLQELSWKADALQLAINEMQLKVKISEEAKKARDQDKRIVELEAALALVIEAADRAPVSSIYMMSAIDYAKSALPSGGE